MPCTVDISPSEEINHFQVLLCQACKYLTKEQIQGLVNPNSGIYDGLDWYSRHLWLDHEQCCNQDSLSLFGISYPFEYETLEIEKKKILKELNRIGYDIVPCKGGTELKEIE